MMSAYDGMTVADLKVELQARGLPISGRKAELIQRLESHIPEEQILEAVVIEESTVEAGWRRGMRDFLALPIPVIVATVLILSGGLGYLGYELVSAFIDDEVEYPELIDFDPARARGYATDLLGYGHAQWEGRMSGTQEELNAAQYISDTFANLGYVATLEAFSVPMFSIINAPTLRLCIPGGTPLVPSCGPLDAGSQITDFEHRTQVVLQGFSGTRNINFGQADVVFLGEGAEGENWAGASGNIGMVNWGNGGVAGNTELYSRAAEHDLAALIVVNNEYNCDKVVAGDCIPIFKGVGVDAVMEANGGTMPDDIAFMMVSRSVGAQIEDAVTNNSGEVSLSTNVQNTGELEVRVPCGTWEGVTEDLVIVGGHHDTVYHGPGAVDDTSGTASVMEMATAMSELLNDGPNPHYTLMFCTWGGEEEGLWGSSAWVEAHQQKLRDHLRLYINLDMNHVDIDQENRGNSVTLFSNHAEDLDHVKAIAAIYQDEESDIADKYSINFQLLDGEGEMPGNSDHAPFVYNLGEGEVGRAVVCYGSGSWEYHTYADDITRFNEESLDVSGTIYGTYVRFLAEI